MQNGIGRVPDTVFFLALEKTIGQAAEEIENMADGTGRAWRGRVISDHAQTIIKDFERRIQDLESLAAHARYCAEKAAEMKREA